MQYLPNTFFEFICTLVLSLVVCIIRHFRFFLSFLDHIYFVQSRLYLSVAILHYVQAISSICEVKTRHAPVTGINLALEI
jgi:hypothetical protein